MRLTTHLRAFPALLRVGLAEAVAYRAEMAVWILATTMPLVMMMLWTAVAAEGPVGRFGEKDFIGYFLCAFVVRLLAGSWAFYEINYEIRRGTLGMLLLRPIHPLWFLTAESLAAIPIRLAFSLPIAAVLLVAFAPSALSSDPAIWAIWLASVFAAWLLTLQVNFLVGGLAFFTESSIKVMDLWTVLFFVFSGYLVPLELFPAGLRAAADWMPFRFQLGFPVELMTGRYETAEALALLARSYAWVGLAFLGTLAMWRRGLARFASYGG